jgi:hypothetical protein
MPLKLEALNAKHGDALLLHFGPKGEPPQFVLIDGGPSGVFNPTLKDRLDELRTEGDEDAPEHARPPLSIRLMMVTHVDDDHISGILELVRFLHREATQKRPRPYAIRSLWYNSFDDLVGGAPAASPASIATLSSAFQGLPQGLSDLGENRDEAVAALATINQGRELRDLAMTPTLDLRNREFGQELVARPESGAEVKDLDGLKLTVLGPPRANVERLRKKWAKAAPMAAKGDKAAAAELARLVADPKQDGSVINLSSLIVLAEFDGRCILLTGDSRTKDILAGLEAAGKLDLADPQSRFPVDVLKVPHHGSARNARKELFERVPARHYVFSANGRDHNPDKLAIEWLVEARGRGDYTVHLTNQTDVETGSDLDAFTLLKGKEAAGLLKIRVRDKRRTSIEVDIGAEHPIHVDDRPRPASKRRKK